MEIKISDLVKAAKEMNELMGLDPAIDVKGKPEEIIAGLKTAKEFLAPEDEVSEDAQNVLLAIEETPVKKTGKAKKEKEPEPEPEKEPVDEGAEDESEPITEPKSEKEKEPATVNLRTLLQETRKLDDLKGLVMQNDEFKSLRKGIEAYTGLAGPRELKGQMLRILGGPEKEEKPVKEKKASTKTAEGPSNKLVVYRAWKGGETDHKKLLELVGGSVKSTTISSWVSSWKRGQNFPAGC